MSPRIWRPARVGLIRERDAPGDLFDLRRLAGRRVGEFFAQERLGRGQKTVVRRAILFPRQNQADLVDPAFDEFLEENQNGGFRQTVAVDDREKFFPHRA